MEYYFMDIMNENSSKLSLIVVHSGILSPSFTLI